MKLSFVRFALCGVFASVCGFWSVLAPAQTPPNPSPAPDAWAIADEIVVTGHHPGPATWRIKKGDAEVWVIGGGLNLTAGQVWDQTHIAHILKGAQALYLEDSRFAPISLGAALFSRHLPLGVHLRGVLSPELYQMFTALAARSDLDPQRYERLKPVFVALDFPKDVYAQQKFRRPENEIADLAGAAGVPVMRSDKTFPSEPVVDAAVHLTPAESESCLAETLKRLSFTLDHAEAASNAWAAGDLKAVRANFAGYGFGCRPMAAVGRRIGVASIDQTVAALRLALQKPGKTVFILPLGSLLQRKGALEQIRSDGVEISSPDL